MEVGREVEKDIKRIANALEKAASAQEKLNELAVQENEQDVLAPGFCPHCAKINPVVRSEGGSGRMNDFVLVAACEECGKVIYAVNNGFTVFSSREGAEALLEERKMNV